ncbi:MAG: hypothetical protein ABIQ15_16175 [Nocardioides sp.]
MTTELDDFEHLTARYQRDLLVHVYLMSGQVHEAEDLVHAAGSAQALLAHLGRVSWPKRSNLCDFPHKAGTSS